jgi:hypothetical protein
MGYENMKELSMLQVFDKAYNSVDHTMCPLYQLCTSLLLRSKIHQSFETKNKKKKKKKEQRVCVNGG